MGEGLSSDGELNVDLVVVGSGAGGLSAAIRAARGGLRVLVLEKTAYFGGSTAISGGVVWIPANSAMAEQGAADSREAARTYLQQTLGDAFKPALVDAFLAHGPAMVDYFKAHTEVQFTPRMYGPDYRSELPGASIGGRGLDPVVFDGRQLGTWFRHLRPPLPQTTVFGGMMVSRYDIEHLTHAWKRWPSFLHSLGILARQLRDRLAYPRGTRLLAGNALAARLLKSAVDSGVELKNRARVTELVRQQGRVVGVVATLEGRTLRIGARRGVVLASGGFAANRAWAARHLRYPDQHLTLAPEGSEGDGLGLATAIGATLGEGNANPVFLTPVSLLRKHDGGEIRFPHLILDRQKPGLIAVNSAGQRFVNEADSYHDFVEGVYRGHGRASTIPAYLICDARFIRRYGLGLARPWPFGHGHLVRAGYLVKAPTLADLAWAIGVPEGALAHSVNTNNASARTGIDEEFGRGGTEYNRYLGDPNHRPNPCIGPISKPPFYAVRVYPGDIGTATGLVTDDRARVLDADGGVIAGLYACGNDMNSIMAGHYPAGGITLGPALTFGYIAAGELLAAGEP